MLLKCVKITHGGRGKRMKIGKISKQTQLSWFKWEERISSGTMKRK